MVSHGFDFDLAFSLDETTRDAFAIIVSEQKSGMTFNWSTREFVRKDR